MYSKILFATDLGPQSLYIAEQAATLAQLCQGTLLALHVVEPPLAGLSDFTAREKAIQQKKEVAEQSLHDLCLQVGVSEDHQFIMVGEGQSLILKVAKQEQCDLIVLGSHGVGGYTHAMGSTAQHIIVNAHCNTLVVQVSHLKDIIEKTVPKANAHPWQLPHIPDHIRPKGPSYGSKKGFGEEVKRGPRLSPRPGSAPYRGGTRQAEEDEDESDSNS
ncbi:MAG: universal stress protein [Candidatus Berkiella sp.]